MQNKGSTLKSFRFTQPQINTLLKQYQEYGFTQEQIITAWRLCGQDQIKFHDVLIQNINTTNKKEYDVLSSKLKIKNQTMLSESNQQFIQKLIDFQQQDDVSLFEQLKNKSIIQPTGLINLGNTCFINIILQYMFNIINFRGLIFQIDIINQTQGQIFLQKFKELFALMQNTNRIYINPREFLDKLQEYKPSALISNGEQNDYNELQIILLDAIEQVIQELKNENIIKQFNQLFYGQSEEIIIYENQILKTTPTIFASISLDIKSGDFLQAFKESRIFHIDDYEYQGKKIKAIIHQNILTTPKVLQFYLNRITYNYQENKLQKENNEFQFPLSIDINEFISDQELQQTKEMQDLLKMEQETLQLLKKCGDQSTEDIFQKIIQIFSIKELEQDLFEPDPSQTSFEHMRSQLELYKEKFQQKRQELQLQFIKIEDQKKKLIEQRKNIYNLTGVLMHQGTAQNGHYYCYLFDGKQWWKYNDRIVTQIDYPQIYCDALGKVNSQGNVCGLIYEQNIKNQQNTILQYDQNLQNYVSNQNQVFLEQIDKQILLSKKAKIIQLSTQHQINYPENQIGKLLIKYCYFEEFIKNNPNKIYYLRKLYLEQELKLIQKNLYCPSKIEEYKQYFIHHSGLFPKTFDQLLQQEQQKFNQINTLIQTFSIQSSITTLNIQQIIYQFQKYLQQIKSYDLSLFNELEIIYQSILLKGCFLIDLLIQKKNLQEAKSLMQFIFDTLKQSQNIDSLVSQQIRENIKVSVLELEQQQKFNAQIIKPQITQPNIIIPDISIFNKGIINIDELIKKFDELLINIEVWYQFTIKLIQKREIIPQNQRMQEEMPLYFNEKLY